MADLTHTVTLTVTIEGVVRQYKYTTVISGAETMQQIKSGTPGTEELSVGRSGGTPLFAYGQFDKTNAPMGITVFDSGLSAQLGPLLMYGGFFSMHKAAAGGNYNSSNTAGTSTFLSADQFNAGALLAEAHGGAAELYIFYA